ncbi:cell division protein ZipA C-terminal FtsZ-binding domain-containing protein [Suttonella sp. R2A3]|uniref:cell division protein ZipA C-terminal FtsZ-binding domain-containing protein n=1 Tax=Suttonella sp. R2A3 TaxID=2908648 RepID=UPI001F23209B|nr:cell division protein ZipA C-terminal FtsZ-binding domain-containing protein [Suttonella sp. R2A3]UJF24779.1 cell division protein ZipA C-terminal FtsZ-binding domain-containing protein [Suttonella sp. R2A3]
MNESSLIFVIRVVAVVLVLIIIGLVLFSIWRAKQFAGRDFDHPKYRSSALDGDVALEADTPENFEIGKVAVQQKTEQLNPELFAEVDTNKPATATKPSKPLKLPKSAKPLKKPKPEMPLKQYTKPVGQPSMTLPYTVMARFGKHFTGKAIADMVKTFGLTRSPNDAFELIGEDGSEVVFSVLNVRKPGVFPKDLSSLSQVDGLMLVMQLPVGDDAVKSWEMFTAMAHEISEMLDGRLCDHTRRPIGDQDLLKYRKAAEQFDAQYTQWLQQQR